MSDNNLRFIESLTVEQFKNRMSVDTIKVKKNPHTGKLFMAYGASVGAVSAKGIPTNPMISLVEPKDGGDQFWLLHNEAEGVATIATF